MGSLVLVLFFLPFLFIFFDSVFHAVEVKRDVLVLFVGRYRIEWILLVLLLSVFFCSSFAIYMR